MRNRITVFGVVQGVGFRPFVARLAEELEINGTVSNSGGMVIILAAAGEEAMDNFIRRLRSCAPSGARINGILVEREKDQEAGSGEAGFTIAQSEHDNDADFPLLPPDLPICADCLRELEQAQDRRFRYPFISCVACGPRYSIMEDIPYDRENISMRDYRMCDSCGEEYTDRKNIRRRHAQTISCKDCGPQLLYRESLTGAGVKDGERGDTLTGEKAFIRMTGRLRAGAVLAVKGIGGYQFVCRADCPEAVERLRELKRRDKKPFAVMFADLTELKKYCAVNREEEILLLSPARPIVLLQRKEPAASLAICPGVGSESRFLGAFLPYTGLHRMLTVSCGPLVTTSGNLSGEPILTEDEDVFAVSSPLLDGAAWNTRRIVTPLDDSVARVFRGNSRLIRRSRGYVPQPVGLPPRFPEGGPAILAYGGDLKAAFSLTAGNRAYLSQYFGDVEDYKVFCSYRHNIAHMQQLLRMKPGALVCDLHPSYLTASLARRTAEQKRLRLIECQHHHAHAASVMAEHGLHSCIGVIFDGTGFGTDETVWGGEFLLCKGESFQRSGHLEAVELCGGDASARDAALTMLCHLIAAGVEPGSVCLPDRYSQTDIASRLPLIRAALKNHVNTGISSSMGRLFDAVCALFGLRLANSYEGECAIALENAAARAFERGEEPLPFPVQIRIEEGCLIADTASLLRELCAGLAPEADEGEIERLALGFHVWAADMVLGMCDRIRKESGEDTVALSGGVFANILLLERCVELLESAGFAVFYNEKVPGNDGGISYGQSYLAGLILAKERETV